MMREGFEVTQCLLRFPYGTPPTNSVRCRHHRRTPEGWGDKKYSLNMTY